MRKFDKVKRKAYQKKWVAKNPDKIKGYYNPEKQRAYYAKNRGHILERAHNYYQKKKFEGLEEKLLDVKDGFKTVVPIQRIKRTEAYYERMNRKLERRRNK